jgi:hypothetical protein
MLPADVYSGSSLLSSYFPCRHVTSPFHVPLYSFFAQQRGITASPRIMVYKAIACRVLNEEQTDINLAESECENSDVQARAAQIQAGLSPNRFPSAVCHANECHQLSQL